MDTLRIGREYKAEVLEEWEEREREKSAAWRGMVERTRFDLKKSVRRCVEHVRHYLSGEFGEPTLKEKRDFLFSAVSKEFFACRTWLLKFGEVEGAIDCQSELDGKTALAIAAENSHLKLVQLLIQRGADPNVRDRFGCTALHYACAAEAFECAEQILEAGAEVDMRDRFGVTPLMKAAEVGDPDIVDLLLEFAASPNLRDRIERWTALHYAGKSGDVETLRTLLKVGCDDGSLSTTKQNAQDIALDHHHKDAAILLTKWRRRKLAPANNKFSLQALQDEMEFE